MKINHVMSQNIKSNIFDSFIGYISSHGEHVVSITPVKNCDVYHYHRPHLELKLLADSIVTIHHDLNETDAWLKYSLFHGRYKEAKKIVCLNSEQKKFLSKAGINNSTIIPHGYNRKVFSDVPEKRMDGKINIGIISKRYGRKVKGESYLEELVLKLDVQKFKFILVGEGRSIEASYLKELGFDCEVFEFLPYELFNSLYENLHYLMIPSKYEGGPACVPEAIATSTPIIGFKVGMLNDFLDKNGFFLTGNLSLDAENINNISSSFSAHYEQAILKKLEIPAWEKIAEMYHDVYKEVSRLR